MMMKKKKKHKKQSVNLHLLLAQGPCVCTSITNLLPVLQLYMYSECVGLICVNKPRWAWLASPPNALINAVVWQTAVYVNACAFTSLWQGGVVRARKQHAAAGGLMDTTWLLAWVCVCVCVFLILTPYSSELWLDEEQMSLNYFFQYSIS